MINSSRPKRKAGAIIALIFAGEAIFFLPFVLARIFRPTLLKVFEISNLELGMFFSVYGVVAMVSYFFGGPLADRFAARNLIAIALVLTGIGGFGFLFHQSIHHLPFLYGFWGFTTIFLFWAALIRATREWGGDNFQGRAFGFLESGRGLTAALIGTIALIVFSENSNSNPETTRQIMRQESFNAVVFVIMALIFLSAIFVLIFLPKQSNGRLIKSKRISVKQLIEVIKIPSVWLNAVIILCAYVGYKITDDYSLYANEVLGYNEVKSASIGTAALWLRPVFAVLAGILADRLSASRVVSWSFLFMILGGILIFSGWFQSIIPLSLIILGASLAGVYGIRGIYFAIMDEANIPLKVTGTAVGIISVLGYTPDVFMSPFMGFLLDENKGPVGHQHVFLVFSLFGLLGFLSTLIFSRINSKKKQLLLKNQPI